MKRFTMNQKGSGHIAVVIVVLFLAVAGFAGFKIMHKNTSVATPASAATKAAAVPAAINSKADLVQVSKALDDSSSQIDGGLNDNTLNADLNDML